MRAAEQPINSNKGNRVESRIIAVIGGTGPQGRGLGYRLAAAGYSVVLGSRDATRAQEKAIEIQEHAGVKLPLTGADNLHAVRSANIVVLAVPYKGHSELVASLAAELDGKIIVSCVNPLGFDELGPFAVSVEDGSAAEEAAKIVPGAFLVGAFHHVSALNLWKHVGLMEEEDVLVCGNDEESNEVVAELARAVTGRKGVVIGGLRLARELEPWTGILISINKRYKVRSGIQVTGLG